MLFRSCVCVCVGVGVGVGVVAVGGGGVLLVVGGFVGTVITIRQGY